MGHVFAIVVLALIVGVLIGGVFGPLWRNRASAVPWPGQMHPDDGGVSRKLVELAALADRLQARIDTLERILDTTHAEWRHK